MVHDPNTLIGRVFAGYRFERLLVETPDSYTFITSDTRFGAPVCLMVLRGPPPGPRLEWQLGVLYGLQHSNLARLHQSFRLEDATPVLVVERAGGQTLQQLLASRPVSLAEVVYILEQILGGLETCHAHGVVHRDLRPGNVRIQPRLGGGIGRVKVLSVGLAQLLSDRSAPVVGDRLYGHPQFTAPEQWVNRQVDARTDIYAVGLLGFALVQGSNFIRPGEPLDVCAQHFRAPRPLLTETAGGEPVPATLAAALARAAHPQQGQRFSSARKMREVLSSIELPRGMTGPIRQVKLSESSWTNQAIDMDASLLDEIAREVETWKGEESLELDESLDETIIEDGATGGLFTFDDEE